MKKIFSLILVLMVFIISTQGQRRTETQLAQILQRCNTKLVRNDKMVVLKSSAILQDVKAEEEAFVVYYQPENVGFVVLSADERMPEVLAMSNDEKFDIDGAENDALMALLKSYAAAQQRIANGETTAEELFGTTENSTQRGAIVKNGPLLKRIAFAQKYPYNEKCPVINGSHAPSGCVPTGMAMMMKYHAYPTTGKGSINYTTSTEKIAISYDFTTLDIKWNDILDTYSDVKDPSGKVFNKLADSLVFAFSSSGKIEYDASNSKKLKLVKFYNYSGSTVSGKLQFIVENAEGTIRQIAGSASKVSNVTTRHGWSSIYLQPSLSESLPDGEYRLYVGFTSDDTNYTYAKVTEKSSNDYYITVTKTGNIFTFNGNKFVCATSAERVDGIATILQACGAACKANYGESSTGAVTKNMCKALNTYFNYDVDMYHADKDHLTAALAKKEISKAINNGRPIVVSAQTEPDSTGNQNGHCYLIDGFDFTGASPMYHINWGWNGSSNGYFLLTKMQPSEAGTGGSTKNYSYQYNLFFDVIPEDSIESNKNFLCTAVETDTSTVSPEDKFYLTVKQLGNASLLKSVSDTVFCYLVNKKNEVYNIGKVKKVNISAEKSLENFRVRMTMPDSVPEGDYTIMLGTSEKDNFMCMQTANIHVNSMPSAIKTPTANPHTTSIYDLSGRKISATSKGLQISNGKKIYLP